MNVRLSPFPHLVIDEAISTSAREAVLGAWPDRSNMHYDTGHDRYYAHRHHSFWDKPVGKLLRERELTPLIEYAGRGLFPYYAHRGGGMLRARIMALHEAGNSFEEHRAHTHYEHNPEYAFTILLYLDDDGRAERGTTLYGFEPKPEESIESYVAHAAGMHAAAMVPTAIPFQKNRALAFVDGPLSMHGSTPFVGEFTGARKMIVMHLFACDEGYRESGFYIEQFARARRGETVDEHLRDLIGVEVYKTAQRGAA
jgi:hypothetical protein